MGMPRNSNAPCGPDQHDLQKHCIRWSFAVRTLWRITNRKKYHRDNLYINIYIELICQNHTAGRLNTRVGTLFCAPNFAEARVIFGAAFMRLRPLFFLGVVQRFQNSTCMLCTYAICVPGIIALLIPETLLSGWKSH